MAKAKTYFGVFLVNVPDWTQDFYEINKKVENIQAEIQGKQLFKTQYNMGTQVHKDWFSEG